MSQIDRTNLYYDDLVAAFVRGRLPELRDLGPDKLIEAAFTNQLRIHKFQKKH